MSQTADPGRRTPMLAYVIVAAVCAAAGFGAVYAIRSGSDRPTTGLAETTRGIPVAPPPAAMPTGSPAAAPRHRLAVGSMSSFVHAATPAPMADIAFTDGDGNPRTLADFRGRTVLLNLWATWCAPCRIEMPSLDRLQATLGSDRFEVVALSIDRQGAPAARKFLADVKAAHLRLYVDSTARSMAPLKITGLPTTILIDPEGREVGRLAGEAAWDSAEALALIRSVGAGN